MKVENNVIPAYGKITVPQIKAELGTLSVDFSELKGKQALYDALKEALEAPVEPKAPAKVEEPKTEAKEVATADVIPTSFVELIATSEMNTAKAEKIAKSYAPIMALIEAEKLKLIGLDPKKPEDVEIAKGVRIGLRTVCGDLKRKKDKDKASVKIMGDFVQGLYNTTEAEARAVQADAEKTEKAEELAAAAVVAELNAERAAEVAKYHNEVIPNLGVMQQVVYDGLLAGLKLQSETAKVDAAKEAEAAAEAAKVAEEARAAALLKAQTEAAEAKAHADTLAEELRVKEVAEKAAADKVLAADAAQAAEVAALEALSDKEKIAKWAVDLKLPSPPVQSALTGDIALKFAGFKKWAELSVKNSK